MIKEAITSIINAENDAERIVLEAEKQAAEIEAFAEIQSNKIREQIQSETAEKTKHILAEAAETAEKQAAVLFSVNQVDTKQEILKAEKNLSKVSDLIINRIMEKYGNI